VPTDHSRRVDHLLRMQGHDPSEQILIDGEIVDYGEHQTQAKGGTYLAEFADGSLAYHKRHDLLDRPTVGDFGHSIDTPPLHECAAWHLAKALGPRYARLLPVTVYRKIDDEWGSLAAAQPGRKPAVGATFMGAPEEVNDAGFFDALIGQQDRHANNLLWDDAEGRLRLIDHGFCFPGGSTGPHRIRTWKLQNQRRQKKLALDEEELALINRVLGSDDLLGIQPLLEPERGNEMTRRLKLLLTSKTIPKVR
jgi:hypothetical protein